MDTKDVHFRKVCHRLTQSIENFAGMLCYRWPKRTGVLIRWGSPKRNWSWIPNHIIMLTFVITKCIKRKFLSKFCQVYKQKNDEQQQCTCALENVQFAFKNMVYFVSWTLFQPQKCKNVCIAPLKTFPVFWTYNKIS